MYRLNFMSLLFCMLCCNMIFLVDGFFSQAEAGTDEVFAQITLLPKPKVSY